MKIFKLLFGKKKKAENVIEPIQSSLESNRDIVEDNFSTPEWIINEAFDKVFSQISVDNKIKNQFQNEYCKAHRSGNPKMEEKAAIEYLANSEWIWHDFEKWFGDFSKKGEWPYMWQRNKLTKMPQVSYPSTIEEAVSFLNVKEMREFLKKYNITVKPVPKKRIEFEKAIIQKSSLNDVLSAIEDHLKNIKKYENKKFADAKCQLLAHTLCMTAYSLRDYYQCKEIRHAKLVAEDSGGTCNIEDQFAKKFNSGEIKEIPPFFPGDRTTLRCKIS